MKKLGLLLTVIFAATIYSFAGEAATSATSYTIDTKTSNLEWTGYHLAKSYQHNGNVSLKSGELILEGDEIKGGSFIIDMTSITNIDVEDEAKNTKLVNHLKSDDFFGVKDFPEATLTIKKTEKITPNSYETTADLTIKGITQTITFETIVSDKSDDSINATADITINRTDFKVMFGWKVSNAMLSKDFNLKVNLTGNN